MKLFVASLVGAIFLVGEAAAQSPSPRNPIACIYRVTSKYFPRSLDEIKLAREKMSQYKEGSAERAALARFARTEIQSKSYYLYCKSDGTAVRTEKRDKPDVRSHKLAITDGLLTYSDFDIEDQFGAHIELAECYSPQFVLTSNFLPLTLGLVDLERLKVLGFTASKEGPDLHYVGAQQASPAIPIHLTISGAVGSTLTLSEWAGDVKMHVCTAVASRWRRTLGVLLPASVVITRFGKSSDDIREQHTLELDERLSTSPSDISELVAVGLPGRDVGDNRLGADRLVQYNVGSKPMSIDQLLSTFESNLASGQHGRPPKPVPKDAPILGVRVAAFTATVVFAVIAVVLYRRRR